MFFVDTIILTHSDLPIMGTKRSADTARIEKAKRNRSSLTLEVKFDILKRKEQGEGTSGISRKIFLCDYFHAFSRL